MIALLAIAVWFGGICLADHLQEDGLHPLVGIVGSAAFFLLVGWAIF